MDYIPITFPAVIKFSQSSLFLPYSDSHTYYSVICQSSKNITVYKTTTGHPINFMGLELSALTVSTMYEIHVHEENLPSMLNTTFYHKGNGLIPDGKLKSFSEWYQVGRCHDIHGARKWFRDQAPGSIWASSNSNPVQFRWKTMGEKSGTKDSFSIIWEQHCLVETWWGPQKQFRKRKMGKLILVGNLIKKI